MRKVSEYLKVVRENQKGITHIKVAFFFSGRELSVSVFPIQREERNEIVIETTMAYSGYKKLLAAFSRYSSKVEKVAEEYNDQDLIQAVANDHGLELA